MSFGYFGWTSARPLAKGDIAEKGKAWFNAGADGQIDWGQHGDFAQCVAIASKHMSNPEGY